MANTTTIIITTRCRCQRLRRWKPLTHRFHFGLGQGWVTGGFDCVLIDQPIKARHRAQIPDDGRSASVFRQVHKFCRAGYWDNVVTLGKKRRKGELRRACVLGGDAWKLVQEGEVRGIKLGRKTRHLSSNVFGIQSRHIVREVARDGTERNEAASISWHAASTAISGLRVHREYSDWTAAVGWAGPDPGVSKTGAKTPSRIGKRYAR